MGTQNLWVFKICDYTKFQVGGRENQNIYVLCISCEQKSICAFSIYAFCHMCKNIPCELGFRHPFIHFNMVDSKFRHRFKQEDFTLREHLRIHEIFIVNQNKTYFFA